MADVVIYDPTTCGKGVGSPTPDHQVMMVRPAPLQRELLTFASHAIGKGVIVCCARQLQ